MTELLEIAGLNVQRGSRVLVRDVEFSLNQGSVLALLGPNGAGKSSLLETVAGLLPDAGGRILLDSRDISAMPAFSRARHGVRFVGQGRQVVPALTVADNLALAAEGARVARPQPPDIASLFPRLGARWRTRAAALSGGEQQMLALAMGLTGPVRVLLLDEPSFGLAPSTVDGIFQQLAELKQRGYTMLIAEQQLNRVLQLADAVAVLGGGRLSPPQTVDQMSPDDRVRGVVEAYLGRSSEAAAAPAAGQVESLVSLSLPVAQKRRLQVMARERGMTPAELIAENLQSWLR